MLELNKAIGTEFYIRSCLMPCHANQAYSIWDLSKLKYIEEHSINCLGTNQITTNLVNDIRNKTLNSSLFYEDTIKNGLCVIESSVSNYYHFVFEILPEIILGIDFASSINFELNNICISADRNFIRQYLALMNIIIPCRALKLSPILIENCLISKKHHRNRGFRFENLNSEEYIKVIKDLIINRIKKQNIFHKNRYSSFPKKIFIERKVSKNQSERRALFPRDLFHEDLIKYGYSIIYLEDFIVEDQIKLFANAEEIIAVHGAALTNILFAQKEARIVELGHMDGFSECFSKIASACSLNNYNRVNVSPLLNREEEAKIIKETYDSTNVLPLKYDNVVKDQLFP